MKECVLKRILLDEGGISQTDLAVASGVSPNTVNKMANNLYVGEKSIAKVAKGLNTLIGSEKYTRQALYEEVDSQ